MRLSVRWHVVTALVALCATSAPVHAEPPANAGALAVQKGEEGIALYERGNWDEAYRALNAAEMLYHSPVFLLYQARSLRNAGHFLQAQTIFRRLNAERIEESAPEPWKRAQADGRIELATLEQEIPSIVIVLPGASAAATITLDGAPALAGQPIALDPGAHVLVVVDGAQREEKAFMLAPAADRQQLVLMLSKPAPSDRTPAAALDRGPYVPGVVIAAAGASALVAGIVVGVIANSKSSHVIENLPGTCEDTSCLPSTKDSIESRLESSRNLATVADVLWISGAALAVAGAALVIVDPRGEPVAGVSKRGAKLEIRF